MTPTLLGRWQTRLLLLATVGVLATLPFAIASATIQVALIFFSILGYVAVFGIGWDCLYNFLQTFRWDRDWPAAFQLAAGIWEGIFLSIVLKTIGLPGIDRSIPLGLFWLHYSLVWLAVFTASQTFMRVIFPRWRFRGGQWL